MSSIRVAALSGAAILLSGASFGGAPNVPRYSVSEAPAPTDARCLPGYAERQIPVGLNEQGIVSSNFRCYTQADATPTPAIAFMQRPYATAAHLGASFFTLPAGSEDNGFTFGLDSTRAYGFSAIDGTRAIAWSLAGGFAPAFDRPGNCQIGGNLDMANGGNENGYTVGFALVEDPVLAEFGIPGFCFTVGWAVGTPSGTWFGPLNGGAVDVNRSNVAVGNADFDAISIHLPSHRQTVLFDGDESQRGTASDINDRGEIVGYIDTPPAGAPTSACVDTSTPLFWQRSGARHVLPKLPGQPSARPFATSANGVAVGESGSGGYCDESNSLFNQRAVIWHFDRIHDLNTLIPASENITLIYAIGITASGLIAAGGYRNDDPLLSCPGYVQNPVTLLYEADFSLTCRTTRTYLLTPQP